MFITGVWGAVTCCTGITIKTSYMYRYTMCNCIRKCINLVFVYIHGHVTEASAERLAMLGVAEASKTTCNLVLHMPGTQTIGLSHLTVCYSPLGIDSTDLWDCDRLQGCTVRPVSDPTPYLAQACSM